MNWEAWTMKSRTSFFDGTLLRKDITRFSPVWLLYLIGGTLLSWGSMVYNEPGWNLRTYNSTIGPMGIVNMCYALIAAECLFGDLFNTRMCNGLHALPRRRETFFITHVTAGVLFSMVNQIFTGIYTGIGDSKSPFWVTGAGLVLNLVLDPLLIFGLGPIPSMGVAGAALATAGSQGIVTLLFLLMIRRQKGFFKGLPLFQKLGGGYLKQTWEMGLPIGIQNVFMSGLSLIIASIVARWGADAIAVQKVGGQVESLSWMISGGFSMAVNAFIGQNYGAKKLNRVKGAYQTATVLMLVWGMLCTLALALLSAPLFQIFIREEEVLPMGVSYLQILGISQLFMCIEASSTGAFNGLGQTKLPSVVSITFNLARIPLALLLSSTSLGLDGIWWAISISSICKGVILTTAYFIYIRKQHLFAAAAD